MVISFTEKAGVLIFWFPPSRVISAFELIKFPPDVLSIWPDIVYERLPRSTVPAEILTFPLISAP